MSHEICILASIGLTACIVLPPGGYDESAATETASEWDSEPELGCTSDVIRYCMDGDVVIHDKNGCFEDLTEDCVSECDDGHCSCVPTATCTEDASGVLVSCTAVVGQEAQEQVIECPYGCESKDDEATCMACDDLEVAIIGCAFGYLWWFDGCGALGVEPCIHGCDPATASCNP